MTEQTPSTNRTEPQTPPPSQPAPKGPSWKRIILWLLIAVVGLGIGLGFGQPIKAALSRAGAMIGIGHDHAENAEPAEGGQYYTCGMHPWVILPRPGDCPICHMKLTPLDPDKFTGEIVIDPVVVQNMGVRVEPVVTGPLVKTIRTVGTVDYDETRVRDVNIKVGGWIEKLDVDFVGAEVKRGDPLFDIYSPDLYAAQEEYLLAWRNRDQIGADFVPEAAQGALDLLEAARTRLEYYDITNEQIQALQDANQPNKTMTIESPHTGVVIEKHANEGMKVDSGMRVFRIADLSKVWIMVTLYEYQLPYIALGQEAVMTLPYIPGETFEGRVIYIYPFLDKKTRQVQVRLVFDNPGLRLVPGMYANVHLRSELAAERTLAPRSAIINTGERQVAFVSLGGGKFEPRRVTMGIETSGGMVEIIDGLKPGEMVVTSGQFLIDSEANIREALAKMIRGDLASDQKVSATTAGASELNALPDAAASALTQLLEQYFTIGDKLAADTIDGVGAPARGIAERIDALLAVEIPDRPHFWHEHEEAASIRGSALELIQAADLAEARLRFADISVALNKLVRATGVPPTVEKQVLQLHCPMYREGQGGSIWLQPAGDVRNPFYGSSMLGCFDERFALPVTGGGQEPSAAPQTQPAQSPVTTQPTEEPASPSASVQQEIDQLFAAYLAWQAALARDEFAEDSDDLRRMLDAAEQLSLADDGRVADLASQVADAFRADVDTVNQARVALKDVSNAMIELAPYAPPTAHVAPALNVAYCPMAKASWLQTGQTVANPYYGASMLTCGSIKEQLPTRPLEGN